MDNQTVQTEKTEQRDLKQTDQVYCELYRPGCELIDPSPLRQAVRAHFKKYAGVTESDGN